MRMKKIVGLSTLVVTACLTIRCAAPVDGPEFKYVESRACSDVIVYTWNEPLTEYLVVEGDLKRLGIPLGSTRTLEIASAGNPLSVRVDMYQEQASYPHCSDVVFDDKPTAWHATSGTMTITRSAEQPILPPTYRVVITVANLVFEGPRGQRVRVAGPITLSGLGGTSPSG
jgi:hypothetical protein